MLGVYSMLKQAPCFSWTFRAVCLYSPTFSIAWASLIHEAWKSLAHHASKTSAAVICPFICKPSCFPIRFQSGEWTPASVRSSHKVSAFSFSPAEEMGFSHHTLVRLLVGMTQRTRRETYYKLKRSPKTNYIYNVPLPAGTSRAECTLRGREKSLGLEPQVSQTSSLTSRLPVSP